MKALLTALRPACALLLLFTLLLGAAYPALVTLINQAAFPDSAAGSLLRGKDGSLVGSRLLGEEFTAPNYFWGRLSATTPPYNAANSGGSNLSPANPALLQAARARIAALLAADPGNTRPVPVDLVTASASGLDPHISVAAAEYQAARVAAARQLPEEQVRQLIARYTESPQFGLLGERRVNVLVLNLALDGAQP